MTSCLSNINPRFEVIHTVSEPDTNWDGRTGRINAQLLRETAGRHQQSVFYLAGPPGMVADKHRILIELGIPPDHIRYEMFRGYGQDTDNDVAGARSTTI